MAVRLVLTLTLGGLVSVIRPSDAIAKEAVPAANPAWVADQSYYPAGYRDLRIAARAQMATFPRSKDIVLMPSYDDKPQYDLIDCNAEAVDVHDPDPVVARYGDLALEVSRIEAELGRLGYKREVWEQPLLAYEHEQLDWLAKHDPPALEAIEEGSDPVAVDQVSADQTLTGTEQTETEIEPDRLTLLAREMDARRMKLQRRKPQIVTEGGCGAGEGGFKIRIEPANGSLWLINAFAFRVCERKVPDPWDHNACGWTQYSAGDEATASGRYIYEARWPGGTVRRGARILEGDPSGEDMIEITFRPN